MAAAEMLTYRVDLPADRYGDDGARTRFVETVTGRLAAIPGVKAAAAVDRLPVVESDSVKRLSGVPYVGRDAADQPWAARVIATPGHFASSGVELLAGRLFEEADLPGRQPVAVINRVAADRYFGGMASAVGRTLTVHEDATASRTATIVGVVSDTRDAERVRSSPQVYEPYAQRPAANVRFIVRSSDPLSRAADVRAVLRAADPLLASSPPRVFATEVDEDDSSHVINGLLSAFGILALSLAAAGLYGVISYAVAQRRREIGVRLALGASPRVVARMIVRDGLRLGATGTAIGLALAALMSHALARASSTLLYGITPTDPATFVGVTLVVVVVTALASWSPARRAMRVDPASTLRTDA
jgi:predicted permease